MESNSESDGEGLQLMNGKSVQRTKEKTDIAVAQKQLVDELVDFRVKMQNLLVLRELDEERRVLSATSSPRETKE